MANAQGATNPLDAASQVRTACMCREAWAAGAVEKDARRRDHGRPPVWGGLARDHMTRAAACDAYPPHWLVTFGARQCVFLPVPGHPGVRHRACHFRRAHILR